MAKNKNKRTRPRKDGEESPESASVTKKKQRDEGEAEEESDNDESSTPDESSDEERAGEVMDYTALNEEEQATSLPSLSTGHVVGSSLLSKLKAALDTYEKDLDEEFSEIPQAQRRYADYAAKKAIHSFAPMMELVANSVDAQMSGVREEQKKLRTEINELKRAKKSATEATGKTNGKIQSLESRVQEIEKRLSELGQGNPVGESDFSKLGLRFLKLKKNNPFSKRGKPSQCKDPGQRFVELLEKAEVQPKEAILGISAFYEGPGEPLSTADEVKSVFADILPDLQVKILQRNPTKPLFNITTVDDKDEEAFEAWVLEKGRVEMSMYGMWIDMARPRELSQLRSNVFKFIREARQMGALKSFLTVEDGAVSFDGQPLLPWYMVPPDPDLWRELGLFLEQKVQHLKKIGWLELPEPNFSEKTQKEWLLKYGVLKGVE